METETKRRLSPVTTMTVHADGTVTWLQEDLQAAHPGAFALARHELEALVQYAYDQHGILAEPSLETEAARTLETETAAEDAHMRSFAQAWGESMRGRS